MAEVRWIDLSEYGLRLTQAKLADGTHVHLIDGGPEHADALAQLGFEPAPTRSDVWLKRGTQDRMPPLLPHAFRAVFPLCAQVQVDAAQTVWTEPAKRPSLRIVGVNRLGQDVCEDAQGRRAVKDQRNRLTFEADMEPPQPGLFLRAKDPASLALCADGLIEGVVRGAIVRADDFAAFLRTIHGERSAESRRAETRTAVEAAAVRWLARKKLASMREVFNGAARIHESLNFLSTEWRDTPTDTHLPLPVAIVAQRVLGTESDLAGRKVLIPSAGSGALLSHLPKGAVLEVHEHDKSLHRHIQGTASAAGLRDLKVGGGTKAGRAADFVIWTHRRSVTEEPVEVAENVRLRRADLVDAYRSLEARADDGRAVFVFARSADAQEEADLARFQDLVGRRYAVEGAVDVDGGLWSGRPEAAPMRVLVVGRRRPEPLADAPEAALRLSEVHDFGSLWTWTAEVVSNRAKVDAFYGRELDGATNAPDPDLEQNAYQVPYVSASRVGTPTTMVPRNLEGATREALARVARLHGDVDEWVATEYGYTREDLSACFSPEQVDALALYLHSEERGRAFLDADQTGVGKGRVLAAVMRRAVLRGGKAVFLSEKPGDFSDIWRDIQHTRSDTLITPFVLNDGVNVIDEASEEVVHRSASREQVDAMLASGTMPEGANAVFATYSQFNREPQDSAKSTWLREALDGGTTLALNESHNATGDSNIGANVIAAIEKAGGLLYASATYAKNAKGMALYARLFPGGVSVEEISAIMESGGETMQEVVSTMLAQDGVMIRREHDLSGLEFVHDVDLVRLDRNRQMMDSFAPVLAAMASITGEANQVVARMNEAADGEAAQDEAPQDALPGQDGADDQALQARQEQEMQQRMRSMGKRVAVSRVGFGSPLYALTRLFVASLKTEWAVERALDALANGRKPAILVENTVESFLEELAEVGENFEGSAFPDFKGLVHRALTSLVTTWRIDENRQKVRHDLSAGHPLLARRVAEIRAMIDRMPDLPASAIDVIKHRIAEAGYVCDEITGRNLEIRDGRVVRRSKSDRTVVKNAFNSGEIDALVLNNAGATGMDLHAGSRFADQRRREMIELQEPADVVRQIQALGRFNRYDQVVGPIIRSCSTGLPMEMRLHAIRNQRLRRLSANVSSNRDNAYLVREIPDLINPVGDMVCTRYAEARPDLMRRLGYDVDRNVRVQEENEKLGQGVETIDSKRSANEFMARLVMLPVALQEQVANELAAEYQAAMEEYEARGENPLASKDLPGIVHVRSKSVFEGSSEQFVESLFDEPLHALDVAIERTVDPVRSEDVMRMIEMGMASASASRGRQIAEHLERHREKILETYVSDRFGTVEQALAAGDKRTVDRNATLRRTAEALRDIVPGREITFTSSDDVVKGIVTAVHHAPRGYEHVASMHAVEFVAPGDVKPRMLKLQTLLRDPSFKVEPGLEHAEYDKILARFDHAVSIKLRSATILSTNIYRGMKLAVRNNLGGLVTYRTEDGTRHRGILVSQTKLKHGLTGVPVELDGLPMAVEALSSQSAELRSSSDLGSQAVVIKPLEVGGYGLRLPPRTSRKWAFIYEHADVEALSRRAVRNRNGLQDVHLREDEMRDALRALHEAGLRFWTSGRHRPWAVEYAQSALQEPSDTTSPQAFAA